MQDLINKRVERIDAAIREVNRLGHALLEMRYAVTASTVDDEFFEELEQVITDTEAMANDAEAASNFMYSLNEINNQENKD